MSESGQADLIIGSMVGGRYRLVRELGAGGMGTVYAADDARTGLQVALKVLASERSSGPEILERFRRETRAVTQIGHPNIVRALDAGILDARTGARVADPSLGRAFLVMELLDGEDLHARLRREERLRPAEGVAIMMQVAAGLGAAHAHGIVHRDLKPENVFLCRDGAVKVLDFGLAQVEGHAAAARVTAQNALLGTPEYMSPEQAAGNPVDARSDVYSLGCIMYELFTGHPPFTGRSFVAVLMAQLAEAPVPPHACTPPARIPAALEALILRALAKEPGARHPNMAALQAELSILDLDAAPVQPARGPDAPLLLVDHTTFDDGEEGPTTLYQPRLADLAPPPRAAPYAAPAMARPRPAAEAAPSPPAAALPAPSRPGAATSPPRRIVTAELAAQPDPLPRILDEIDPPHPRRLDLTVILALVLLAASLAGLAVWLLLR
ncbi:MAG TPA: serine/threonine-protein kinase [Polyangia bacterium]